MTHTIAIGQCETAQQLENVVNRINRHCKIGKVRQKFIPGVGRVPFPPAEFPPRLPYWPSISTPGTGYPIAWWQNPVVSTC